MPKLSVVILLLALVSLLPHKNPHPRCHTI